METTFITIHDLSPDARILYTSDSIIDLLGYAPEEVVNRSCWDFFHPDEIPLARARHGDGVQMDKAAVLSYCLLRDSAGQWIGCEVVFTVVFDVMVGCTSIYRRGLKSRSRATDAPAVRRLFSASPRDPRYHMLSHLSSKFSLPPIVGAHEPRAALFLNRYTRTLTIMYATDGLTDILGISGDALRGRSFYYCIEENCLQDAVRCLENAKANDSIAYLRFWYRDPRHCEEAGGVQEAQDEDINDSVDEMMEDVGDESPEDMNVERGEDPSRLRQGVREHSHDTIESQPVSSTDGAEPSGREHTSANIVPSLENSRQSSGHSSGPFSHEAVFGEPEQRYSSASSMSNSPSDAHPDVTGSSTPSRRRIELEAVVSCTSDGLVVCMRRARPILSNELQRRAKPMYTNGLFAVPWATEPMMPPPQQRPVYARRNDLSPSLPSVLVDSTPQPKPTRTNRDDLMSAIRDIAVFAWALTGINGSLAEYGRGQPRGEAQPASGLPIWQPESDQRYPPPMTQSEVAFEQSNAGRTIASLRNLGPVVNFSRPASILTSNNGHAADGNRQMVDSYGQKVDGTGPMTNCASQMMDGIDGDREKKQYAKGVDGNHGKHDQMDGVNGNHGDHLEADGMDGDNGRWIQTDGVDGIDGADDKDRQYASSSREDCSISPNSGYSQSYQFVPMLNGQGEMVDGVSGQDPKHRGANNHAADGRSKKLWSSSSSIRDGTFNSEIYPTNNAMGTLAARRGPSDPYGFGDPGLHSRNSQVYKTIRHQDATPHRGSSNETRSSGRDF